MAIIKWTQPCMKYIPIIPTEFDTKNGVFQLGNLDHVLLYPGWNLVPDAEWNNARQHVLGQIARGEIIEKGTIIPAKKAGTIKRKDGETETVDASREEITRVSLKSFQLPEVREIIFTCNNPYSLKEWIKIGDSREGIVAALEKRLEEVEKKVPTKPEYSTPKKQWQINPNQDKPQILAEEYLKK